MNNRSDDRQVSFKKPPVNEVYLMVQAKADVFPAGDIGLLAKTFGARFPKIETHPRSDRVRENPPGTQIKIQVQVESQLGQRLWMVTEDDTRLIQIQADRFVYNWRQVLDHLEYPRYSSVRTGFVSHLEELLRASKLDPASEEFVDVCELSYINIIDIPSVDDVRRAVHRVFLCAPQPLLDHVDHLRNEEHHFNWVYSIFDEGGAFVGRLRIVTISARSTLTQRPVLQTQMVFRGQPSAPTLPAAMAFYDRGHQAIVRAFKSITTDEVHALWEEEK